MIFNHVIETKKAESSKLFMLEWFTVIKYLNENKINIFESMFDI